MEILIAKVVLHTSMSSLVANTVSMMLSDDMVLSGRTNLISILSAEFFKIGVSFFLGSLLFLRSFLLRFFMGTVPFSVSAFVTIAGLAPTNDENVFRFVEKRLR